MDVEERVWMVRSSDGREASDPVSLSKIRRGLHLGKLTMDMEVARVGTERWEPVLSLIARYEPVPRADESAPFSALSGDVSPPPLSGPGIPAPVAPAVVHVAPPALASFPAGASEAEARRLPTPIVDRIEKGARAALWLTLAFTFLGVPVSYWRSQRGEAAFREERDRAEAKFRDELAKERALHAPQPTAVLPIASFGSALSVLNHAKAEGHTWFSNVSARSGVVCLEGVATNPTTQRSTTSLASCASVAAYASDVHVGFMFGGRNLEEICPKATCDFSVKDASESKSR